jgi:hypothetical protein
MLTVERVKVRWRMIIQYILMRIPKNSLSVGMPSF